MRPFLLPGSFIVPPSNDGRYIILDRIGSGSSCAVYHTEYYDNFHFHTEHLLKEYNPAGFPVWRMPDGQMKPQPDVRAAYEAGKDRFLEGVRKTLMLRRRNSLKNYVCNIQRVFPANGSWYADLDVWEGVTYESVRETSLFNLLQRMKTLSQVVGRFHQEGFWCMDLKPGNLFVIPKICEWVMLFDFDSLIEIGVSPEKTRLRYTHGWAPPEYKLPSLYRRIGKASDLYAIGEMIFFQIFGRHSMPGEHKPSSVFQFQDAPLLLDVDPAVYPLLARLFQKTICTRPESRFQQAVELQTFLEELIWKVSPVKTFSNIEIREIDTGRFFPDPICDAVDSGDYTRFRSSAGLKRIKAENNYGKYSTQACHAVFAEAAACFAQLASYLERKAIPPEKLIDDFLNLVREYLTRAKKVFSGRAGGDPHCGSLAAFGDGLQQTVSLYRDANQMQTGWNPADRERTLLDAAYELFLYAADVEAAAELRFQFDY